MLNFASEKPRHSVKVTRQTRNMVRTTRTTEGKKITFSYTGDYYTEDCKDIQDVFEDFEDMEACVLYTAIVRDKGWREVTRFGTPSIENYDNGFVGYQNANYFYTIEEAEEDFELAKKLSPKVGIVGYADVMLVVKK